MNMETKAALINAASNGDRVVFTPKGEEKAKTLWAGLGNRAGLHSFACTLIYEKWGKSGERFMKKLDGLGAGTLAIQQYRAKTRDAGRWVTVATHEVK
jgi:hypothetical protein